MEQPKFWQLPDGSWMPMLCGGDGPDVPAEDPELKTMQKDLLKRQVGLADKADKLEPILLEASGLKYNPSTKTYEYIDPALQENKREIERRQTERSLKALRGELPVSETLKKELELGKNRLNEKLYRQLGPGYELSTPGQMAAREYDTMATQLKEGEQRDMLTTAEALSLNRGASRAVDMGNFENPFASTARSYDVGARGIGSAREQDNYTRGMLLQGNMAAGQEKSGMVGAGVGAIGLGVALAI